MQLLVLCMPPAGTMSVACYDMHAGGWHQKGACWGGGGRLTLVNLLPVQLSLPCFCAILHIVAPLQLSGYYSSLAMSVAATTVVYCPDM